MSKEIHPDIPYLFNGQKASGQSFFLDIEKIENCNFKALKKPKLITFKDVIQIFIIEKGGITFWANGKRLSVKNHSVVLIPSEINYTLKPQAYTYGTIISASSSFYKDFLSLDLRKENPSDITVINVEESYETVKSIAKGLEFNFLKRQKINFTLIDKLLPILLLEFFRSSQTLNKEEKHFEKFISVLNENSRADISLNQYAELLGITTTHLNRVCKNITGKTASNIYRDVLMSRAKKYLLSSTYQVAEVATLLHFASPSYFNRFFKKETGLTPKAYRMSYQSR